MKVFQQRCQERVRETLSDSGIDIEFASVQGRTEEYLLGVFDLENASFEIYIYGGLMKDGTDWRIWERPDFGGPDELLTDFLANLSSLINDRSVT